MVAQIDQEYYGLGFQKVIRRLASYGLFEGRPATTKGQFVNPLVFGWLKILEQFPCSMKVEKPIFVTGLGRSGTTILGVLLSAHKDVGFLNEPKAIWQVIEPGHDLNDNYSTGRGQYRLGVASPDTASVAHKVFGQYLNVVRAKRVADKYPEMIFRIDFLLSIFPDAKIVFISRDGRSAAHSIVKWSERLGVNVGARVDDWWGRSDSKWHCLLNQILLVDPYFSELSDMLRPDLDHTHRAALEWIATMREGLRQNEAYPGRIHRISYERLIANQESELQRLQQFCELRVDPSVTSYAQKVLYGNPTKEWPSLEPRVDRLFRETMTALGYGEPG